MPVFPVALALAALLFFPTSVSPEAEDLFYSQPAPDSVTVCFAPEQACDHLLIRTIAGARSTIRVAAYSFTSRPIAQALIAASGRGVDVRVVLDSGQRTARSGQGQRLYEHGVGVRYDDRHAIQHNKFMVVDGMTTATGSYNFTEAARSRNAENLVLIRGRETARQFAEEWERHWRHGKPARNN